MNFIEFVNQFKNNLNKEKLCMFNELVKYDDINLLSSGPINAEGYQIFTPEYVVRHMIEIIGEKEVFNVNKNILEPTSGDGAFTTYILKNRLEKNFIKDIKQFEIIALKALSTIYSVEMDKELLLKQRNNIYSVFYIFEREHSIKFSDEFYNVVKCIIISNFIWGMFNTDAGDGFLIELVYKMPEASKNKFKNIMMPVWDIHENSIEMHLEDIELW